MVFLDDKLNGITKFYYESGKLKYEIVYRDNKVTGRKYYDESGRLLQSPTSH